MIEEIKLKTLMYACGHDVIGKEIDVNEEVVGVQGPCKKCYPGELTHEILENFPKSDVYMKRVHRIEAKNG